MEWTWVSHQSLLLSDWTKLFFVLTAFFSEAYMARVPCNFHRFQYKIQSCSFACPHDSEHDRHPASHLLDSERNIVNVVRNNITRWWIDQCWVTLFIVLSLFLCSLVLWNMVNANSNKKKNNAFSRFKLVPVLFTTEVGKITPKLKKFNKWLANIRCSVLMHIHIHRKLQNRILGTRTGKKIWGMEIECRSFSYKLLALFDSFCLFCAKGLQVLLATSQHLCDLFSFIQYLLTALRRHLLRVCACFAWAFWCG